MHRNLFFLLLLNCFVCQIFGENVENYIFIYKTKSFINEKKEIIINKEKNYIKLKNFDINNIYRDTFFINYNENLFKNFSYKIFTEDYFNKLEGKKAKIVLKNKSFIGEIINDGNYLILKTEKEVLNINKNQILYIEFFNEKFESGDLIIEFEAKEKKRQIINLCYFTSAIFWNSYYNLILNDNGLAKLYLDFIIEHKGNANYKKSKVYIVIGDIDLNETKSVEVFALKAHNFEQENNPEMKMTQTMDFYEYEMNYLLDLERQKNIRLNYFKNLNISYIKQYVYESRKDEKNIYAKFAIDNTKQNNLGFPLPAGKISVFNEKNGILHYVSSDSINDIPENEKIMVNTGKVLDIIVDRKLISKKKISENNWDEKFCIKFKNLKSEETKIKVKEYFDTSFWSIKSINVPYNKIDGQSIEFEVKVKPQGIKEIEYIVNKMW